ncbi:hypothetical protein [uncultured Paraglaciecola sp.]|jgi:hypothetical protein|uniref:hypothetical protein n=1 Tax=uncultured Paraglaciecola sp. TaxID=1765024 RepID=UPI00262B14DD|nr:hypothetical protein [uncultured Paraglaciecola sp.]
MESAYNQHVKRQLETSRFQLEYLGTCGLKELYSYLDDNKANDFILRAYWKNLNIVENFLPIFKISLNQTASRKRINTSCYYEALEFKRWANRFFNIKTSHALDKLLQEYNGETKKYSLLAAELYEHFREESYQYVFDLSKKNDIENIDQLLGFIKNAKQKTYVNKELTEQQIKRTHFFVWDIRPKIYEKLLVGYEKFKGEQQAN